MLGIGELTLVLIVIVVVLSIKRLPDLVRSAGKAARIFKSEKRALKDQDPDADGGPHRPSPRVIRGETAERDTP
ncbi:twin-arginine translocase TatA/TatE family subunit [Streptomyces globisporus]|uniref:twin-arginine translocase TatA/TatE family subunit n=1 Tax=Streptomyces globisporus TaxID=1908 RepID=UPI00346065FA